MVFGFHSKNPSASRKTEKLEKYNPTSQSRDNIPGVYVMVTLTASNSFCTDLEFTNHKLKIFQF